MTNHALPFSVLLCLLIQFASVISVYAQDPQRASRAVRATDHAGSDKESDDQEHKAARRGSESDLLDLDALKAHQGSFSFYWDDEEGKVWLEFPSERRSFIYVSSLATGLGSNPVGLDRGQLGDTRLVHFRRVGRRAYLVQENWKYRVSTENPAELTAVRDSFAESILWSAEVKSATKNRQVIDLTSFLLRDAHDVIGKLRQRGQGEYRLSHELSHVHLPRTKAFPQNTEFEAALTFTSRDAGSLARRTAADGNSVTLRQHHSLVQLPEPGYRPRRFDPRAGCFSIEYSDYGMPIDHPLEQRLITRHRLEKADPEAERSPPVEPLIYYVDPGAPEPIRSTLIEGAGWWNEAFEAAGFENAFQVQLLPEDADPMDVRYNVIQWVHRATRGWSYGQSVVDPRTGEILKGHVLLGSLRVRQDHLLFEGLPTASADGQPSACGLSTAGPSTALASLPAVVPETDSVEVALARIRQLSAHEVGHTLGFAHNFAASTYADRASVMDYPAPRTLIEDGMIDLSDAYGVGVGAWDRFTVRFAYSQFDPAEESQRLDQLVREALEKGFIYISDADARPSGAAHPLANLWDDGEDPIAALAHALEVRRLALDSFDSEVVPDGQPLAESERSFVPVYLHHRYQVDAVTKYLGGFYYSYALPGDGQTAIVAVPIAEQRRALDGLLATLQPDNLIIPDRILRLLPPKAVSSPSDRERFEHRTSPIFDPTVAMEVAADLTIANLLQPARAARLARQSEFDLNEVIQRLIEVAFARQDEDVPSREQEAERIVQDVLASRLMDLESDSTTTLAARTAAIGGLVKIVQRIDSRDNRSIAGANGIYLRKRIVRHLDRPAPSATRRSPPQAPPGSPIGNADAR